ncbi:MAG: DUF1292 domain-containing protein [Mollicutes bacterium]|nr:DUF1292 domain-containing protein [Mollicutes bacterium]
MNYQKYDTVELDGEKEYIVVDSFKYNDYKYVYLVNPNDSKEVLLTKEEVVDGQSYLTEVTDKKEYERVALEIVKRNKEDLKAFLGN